MIKLTINEKDYEVKTEWKEYSFNEYAKLLRSFDKPLIDRLHIASSVPKDLIEKMTMAQINFISDALSYIDEPNNAFLFTVPFKDELNIGRRPYKELEQALVFIRKESNPVLAFDKVVKIFYDEEIGEQSIVECAGKASHVYELITEFLNEFKRLNEYEMSVEEIEAGVEDLSKFGFFATAVQLARKYGKTHDEILAMPAREVYTTLLYDFEQSEVERKLIHIRQRNAKTK